MFTSERIIGYWIFTRRLLSSNAAFFCLSNTNFQLSIVHFQLIYLNFDFLIEKPYY